MEKKEDKTQRIVENSLFATMQRMQKENKMFFTRNIKSRSVDHTSDLFFKGYSLLVRKAVGGYVHVCNSGRASKENATKVPEPRERDTDISAPYFCKFT